MQPNEDIYYIPVNFTDAGRVLGLFELRNCIEAAVLAARLKLADTVRAVIANCLSLIGVAAPEKM